MSQRDCVRCGESFRFDALDGRKRKRRYCSVNCQKRAWENSHRKACSDCGGALGTNSVATICVSCWREREKARTAERGHQIEQWWAAGASLSEIASRLAMSRGYLSVEINRLRDKGFDLPYRHRYASGNKHPELAA